MLKYFASALVATTIALISPSFAQTIGYADAIDRLAVSCRSDIAKYCSREPLGGGRMSQCLEQSRISPNCRNSINALGELLQRRAAARAMVPKVCDADIRRVCDGVVQGDGNLMECYRKAGGRVSDACRRAVVDAGFETPLAPAGRGGGPINLSAGQLVASLQSAESTPATVITAARLRQLASQSLSDPSRANRVNRRPLLGDLNQLAQFTIAVQFDLGSSRIRPDSFRAVGLMADALNHPYLLGYRFIVVGHTDGRGRRQDNLVLSQQRADAIRDALIVPFGIAPDRIEAVGLGEEQFLNAANPGAAQNRRVQLINIGK